MKEDCDTCKHTNNDSCLDQRNRLGDDCWESMDVIHDSDSYAFMIMFRFNKPGEHVVYARIDNETGERSVTSEPVGKNEDPALALRRAIARADTEDDIDSVDSDTVKNGVPGFGLGIPKKFREAKVKRGPCGMRYHADDCDCEGMGGDR